ncbi:hypothetical protein TNCV_1718781 [Trichonephila clavipes]|nr:hypothetical protein TNCV_1718781 [Trichonephila clavipes]
MAQKNGTYYEATLKEQFQNSNGSQTSVETCLNEEKSGIRSFNNRGQSPIPPNGPQMPSLLEWSIQTRRHIGL